MTKEIVLALLVIAYVVILTTMIFLRLKDAKLPGVTAVLTHTNYPPFLLIIRYGEQTWQEREENYKELEKDMASTIVEVREATSKG